MRFEVVIALVLVFVSVSFGSAGAQDFREQFDQCAENQDDLERLACYDQLRTPVPACPVSDDEAKHDALRLATLLRVGDSLFATDFGTYYGLEARRSVRSGQCWRPSPRLFRKTFQ